MSNSADGFGEREVGRPQPASSTSPPKKAWTNSSIVPGEVAHRDAPVDDQTLDLVERRQVGGVGGVGAERPPGSDDVDRRLGVLHRADLHRRRVRPQHHLFGLAEVDEDACRSCPGPGCQSGMLSASKLYQARLDLGALGHGEAHADEDVLEPVAGLGDEVQRCPRRISVAQLGEVEPLGFELVGAGGGREAGPGVGDLRLDASADLVEGLARRLALVGIEPTELLLRLRQRRLLAEELGVERGERRRGRPPRRGGHVASAAVCSSSWIIRGTGYGRRRRGAGRHISTAPCETASMTPPGGRHRLTGPRQPRAPALRTDRRRSHRLDRRLPPSRARRSSSPRRDRSRDAGPGHGRPPDAGHARRPSRSRGCTIDPVCSFAAELHPRPPRRRRPRHVSAVASAVTSRCPPAATPRRRAGCRPSRR